MRKYIPLFFVFALSATAQISDIPSCSLNCIATGYSTTGCALADYACQCTHISELWDTVTPCIKAACSASDVQSVRDAVVPFCKEYGVEVSLPAESKTAAATATVVVGASTSADASTTAVASSGGTKASSSASPTDSGANGSTASDTGSSSGPAATGQTSTNASGSSGSSKPPIGAIVGGVVGGLAVLCVACVTIFYIKRRHPRPVGEATQDAAPAQSSSVLPKYEYSSAPEVAQTGQAGTYCPPPASAPAYGASELGGQNMGGYAAHELPAVRKE